ncbi:MAG: thioesterase family protein [Desulfobacula sp.]|nr:thioesterase family protein [Desulfobacula sp.]
MARIKIDIPKKFEFETNLDIRIQDINYGNHVGHDCFISILHEARLKFFKTLGYTETDIEGKALVISDLAVSYKSQCFYGDALKIQVQPAEFNKYGCDIFYRVTHVKTQALILLAKTGIVFFDYTQNKIARVPEPFAGRYSSDI